MKNLMFDLVVSYLVSIASILVYRAARQSLGMTPMPPDSGILVMLLYVVIMQLARVLQNLEDKR